MAKLSIKSADLPTQAIELKLGTNRLGRALDNDFPLDHPTISGHHCEVIWLNDAVTVKDLDSTNGTFIDGQPIGEAVLPPGHALRLGELELVLDAVPANIAIPELHFEAPPTPVVLADGSRTCLNHPNTLAVYECVQCHQLLCDACVRELQRVGGAVLRLCPACSGRCEPVPGQVEPVKQQSETFMGRLRKTLKIVTGRKRR